ncbi:MAG: DUF1992 domain-containing protein [Nitrospiraceae bacterium]|nr:DUF1992 domain-containing protein [Nitrospiraceae bacterium]
MFNFIKIAENRIQEAMKQGEFDDVKGRGRPLVFEDNSLVPPDLRMAYKMLKNAGFLPPELQEEKEIKSAMDLLETLDDERKRYRQVQKLNLMITKINISRRKPINLEKNQIYYRKVVERVEVKKT